MQLIIFFLGCILGVSICTFLFIIDRKHDVKLWRTFENIVPTSRGEIISAPTATQAKMEINDMIGVDTPFFSDDEYENI